MSTASAAERSAAGDLLATLDALRGALEGEVAFDRLSALEVDHRNALALLRSVLRSPVDDPDLQRDLARVEELGHAVGAALVRSKLAIRREAEQLVRGHQAVRSLQSPPRRAQLVAYRA